MAEESERLVMEKELIQLYEAARKAADAAVDGGPEEDRCLDTLNRLKSFPVSYQILVSTQVGKRLRGLTKHNSNKIRVLASEVVEIWEDVIVKETLKNKKNGEIKNEAFVNVEKVKSVKVESMSTVKTVGNNLTGISNSEKTMNSESDTKVTKVDVIKTERSPSVEQMKVEKLIKEEKSSSEVIKPKQEPVGPPKLNSIIYCKDAVRDKMREILAEALLKVSSEVDEDLRVEVNACDPYRVAVSVETAMFEKWGKSNGAQTLKYRSIMFYFKDPNNPDFRRKVLLGQFGPHTIPELTHKPMSSEAMRSQIEEIKKKAILEFERGVAKEASTNMYRCGRCGKRETKYFEVQSLCAFEPMTTYVTCVNCGTRWKFT